MSKTLSRTPPPIDHIDYRYPLYIGEWTKSLPTVESQFATDNLDEPHLKRRLTILKHYPEIEKLYGYDSCTVLIALFAVFVQLCAAFVFGRVLVDWHWTMCVCAYVVGGSASQLLGNIIHEAAHGLTARTMFQNRIVGLIANIGIPVPLAMSFRRYHLEHHVNLGIVGIDPDLPMKWEAEFIGGNAIMKFLWLNIYPILYVARGIAIQKYPPQMWEYLNVVFTSVVDLSIYVAFGMRGFGYLCLSAWFGYGLHPAAARLIQEHYTFDDGQETYSYYGILNYFFMNSGYHNEHHDFTKIPWSRLPEVRKIANEYYENLAYHTSWFMVHWNFITQTEIGPQSRVKRTTISQKRGRKLLGLLKEALNKELKKE
ncbi:8941_t:CDS:2 [Paraglomus occultum]|uniref:8941_t:CDS:1 n=1 Tax=Paraglomus occultum TaxID=144539 RepID=A0A9N8VNS0_9GLOM|nr:8941_t:CDS:2 [Paraglomus occultum]